MGIRSIYHHQLNMIQRERGRPRSASDELRANNYRDENGHYQVSELQPWHERIIDFMVLNPHAKLVDIARAFDKTPQWIGQLLKTDAFREKYDLRMREHQGLIGQQIISKMQSVAVKSLDRMNQLADAAPKFDEAKSMAELTLKGLGYLTNGAGVHVRVQQDNSQHMVVVDSGVVERARAKLYEKMKENSRAIEHQPGEYQRVTSSMDVGMDGVSKIGVESSDDE